MRAKVVIGSVQVHLFRRVKYSRVITVRERAAEHRNESSQRQPERDSAALQQSTVRVGVCKYSIFIVSIIKQKANHDNDKRTL